MNYQELLKKLENDKYIFHFTKLETALEKILPSARLKFSKLENTNDPFEYKNIFFTRTIVGEKLSSHSKESKNAIAHLNELRQTKFRMISFTRNKRDSNGFFRPRMWSQYGDNHKGICIVLDKTKLISVLKGYREAEFKYIDTHPMCYQEKFNQSAFNYSIKDGKDNIENYKKHLIDNKEALFFTKHIDYENESELRALIYSEKNVDLFVDIKDCIVAVFVGTKFNKIYIPIIKEFEKRLKIDSYQVYWHNNEYLLLETKL